MITIKKYSKDNKSEWDNFNRQAKNGHFLFDRDYMDYHSDRFCDHSLLVYTDDKLMAILPANEKDNEFISHGGLTFGGIVTNYKTRAEKVISIFHEMSDYLTNMEFKKFIYKAKPSIYSEIPSEEDLYALNFNGFKLTKRDISSTIIIPNKQPYAKGRKGQLNKAVKNGLVVRRSDDFDFFMKLESDILEEKYGVKPVHTSEEMTMLANLFSNNIKLYMAYRNDSPLGGTIIFENKQTAHCQYIAITEEGKQLGALDIVIDHLLLNVYQGFFFFDFGISTENNGLYLNSGLIRNKEDFGASATVIDTYELNL